MTDKKPTYVPTNSMRSQVEEALTLIMMAEIGLEPNGFRAAVLMCKHKETGKMAPVYGLYRIDDMDGHKNIAWMPLFVYINFESEVEKWLLDDVDNGVLVTGEELKLLLTKPKGSVQ